MRNAIITSLVMAMLTSTAHATQQQQGSSSPVHATSISNSSSVSNPSQQQHQQQQQSITNSNSNVNNNSNVNANSNSNRNSNRNSNSNSNTNSNTAKQYNSQRNNQSNQQVHNEYNHRPSGVAPSIGLGGFASGPCVGVTTQAGVSLGLPGGASAGIGGGRSELDVECTRRETARVLYMIGQHELAVRVMLASPVVREIAPLPVPAAPGNPTSITRDPRCDAWGMSKSSDFYKVNCQ